MDLLRKNQETARAYEQHLESRYGSLGFTVRIELYESQIANGLTESSYDSVESLTGDLVGILERSIPDSHPDKDVYLFAAGTFARSRFGGAVSLKEYQTFMTQRALRQESADRDDAVSAGWRLPRWHVPRFRLSRFGLLMLLGAALLLAMIWLLLLHPMPGWAVWACFAGVVVYMLLAARWLGGPRAKSMTIGVLLGAAAVVVFAAVASKYSILPSAWFGDRITVVEQAPKALPVPVVTVTSSPKGKRDIPLSAKPAATPTSVRVTDISQPAADKIADRVAAKLKPGSASAKTKPASRKRDTRKAPVAAKSQDWTKHPVQFVDGQGRVINQAPSVASRVRKH